MENYTGRVVLYKGEELVVLKHDIYGTNGEEVRDHIWLAHEDPELLEKDKEKMFESFDKTEVPLKDLKFLDRENKLVLPKILEPGTVVTIKCDIDEFEGVKVNGRLAKVVGDDRENCYADLSDLNYYVKLLEPPYIHEGSYDVMLHKDEIIVKED